MPALLPNTTNLVIRNELSELARLSEALARIGAAHGLAPKPLFQLQVALDEMVSNVIKYAWSERGSHEVQVCVTVSIGQVEIEVVDDGRAFDPLAAPVPKTRPPGRRPAPGGLGIHMVRQFMDKLEYARIAGRNHLRMAKRCSVGEQTTNQESRRL